MVKVIKWKLVLGRGGALILLVILGGINRIASKDQYITNRSPITGPSLDSVVSMMKQGDLVLRRGRDIASFMISRTNNNDQNYSHCGLVQVENGYPFVYHFIGGDQTQGLHRDSAQVFLSPKHNNAGAIMRYELSKAELQKQKELITELRQNPRPYDNDFTLGEDRLYCAEFIYKVMNTVKVDNNFIGARLNNGYAYVPLDALYEGKTSLIWQMTFK